MEQPILMTSSHRSFVATIAKMQPKVLIIDFYNEIIWHFVYDFILMTLIKFDDFCKNFRLDAGIISDSKNELFDVAIRPISLV